MFMVFVPLGKVSAYKMAGYIPSYYLGWPWSWLLLTAFAFEHALLRIQGLLTAGLIINGVILGIFLNHIRVRK
jgi:hypothetical protein